MKCLVIDDEPLAREAVERLIKKMPELTLVHSFGDVGDAQDYILNNDIDLIFLDIELSGDNGVQFATTLPENVLIIFITAYSRYAVDSYEVDAIDYLLKPLSLERFRKAAGRALEYHKLLKATTNAVQSVSDNSVLIRSDRRFHKILFDDILFISGLKDYVVIQTATERLLTNLNLKTMHARLPQDKFLRTGKSFLVNKNAVTSFDNSTVFIGDHEIPIGKFYQKDILARLK